MLALGIRSTAARSRSPQVPAHRRRDARAWWPRHHLHHHSPRSVSCRPACTNSPAPESGLWAVKNRVSLHPVGGVAGGITFGSSAANLCHHGCVPRLAVIALLALLVAVPAQAPAAEPPPVVATVGDAEITRARYEHWAAILRGSPSGGEGARLRMNVVSLLIGFEWVRGEAARRDLVVTRRQVLRRLRRQKAQTFPTAAAYRRFLRRSGQTGADIRFRLRIDLLSEAISEDVLGERRRFVRRFERRWRARTLCAPEYLVEDCGGELPAG